MLPYLLLCREDARQREHDLRAVFNAVRYMARSGCSWRLIPNDLLPWAAVYQQFRRWLDAGVFEALVADVQSIVRVGRAQGAADGDLDRQPHAAVHARVGHKTL